MDDSIAHLRAGGTRTFGELLLQPLDFHGAKLRPRRRYLYSQYVLARLRMQRRTIINWSVEAPAPLTRTTESKPWMKFGRYFKSATLRILAQYIAEDVDVADIFGEPERANAWDLIEGAARIGLLTAIHHEQQEARAERGS